jgi:hypothetical protein
MEAGKKTSLATVIKVSRVILPILAIAFVIFLLVTIFAKPVYSPGADLSIVMGAGSLFTAVSAVLLIIDYKGKEEE